MIQPFPKESRSASHANSCSFLVLAICGDASLSGNLLPSLQCLVTHHNLPKLVGVYTLSATRINRLYLSLKDDQLPVDGDIKSGMVIKRPISPVQRWVWEQPRIRGGEQAHAFCATVLSKPLSATINNSHHTSKMMNHHTSLRISITILMFY